jgi:hypothetical protein
VDSLCKNGNGQSTKRDFGNRSIMLIPGDVFDHLKTGGKRNVASKSLPLHESSCKRNHPPTKSVSQSLPNTFDASVSRMI